jgi:hypothetical protein
LKKGRGMNKRVLKQYKKSDVTKEVLINKRKSEVFDFDKIEKLGYPLVIILSPRGY